MSEHSEQHLQPAPVARGLCVPEYLIAYLKMTGASEDVVRLIEQRDAFGRKKYGQSLHTEDGRRDLQDALEEIGDFMQYAFKMRLKGSSTASLLPYLKAAMSLCEDE
jgi:hypothetical protein